MFVSCCRFANGPQKDAMGMLRDTRFSDEDHIQQEASACSFLAVLLNKFCWFGVLMSDPTSRKPRRVLDLVSGAIRNASGEQRISEVASRMVVFHEDVLPSPFAPPLRKFDNYFIKRWGINFTRPGMRWAGAPTS